MPNKPFRGVIENWRLYQGQIYGVLAASPDGEHEGERIITSTVVRLSPRSVETLNSRYYLATPEVARRIA